MNMKDKKRLLSVLTLLLLTMPFIRGEVISIDAKATGLTETGFITTAQNIQVGDISLGINQYNPTTCQMRTNNTYQKGFNFYNKTRLPELKRVSIIHDRPSIGTLYMKAVKVAIGESTNISPSSDIPGVSEQSGDVYVTTFTVPGGMEASYFKIQLSKAGSGINKAIRFEIEYGGQAQRSLAPYVNGINDTEVEHTVYFTDSQRVTLSADTSQPESKLYCAVNKDQFFIPTAIERNEYKGSFLVSETSYMGAVAKNGEQQASKCVKVRFVKLAASQGPWRHVKDTAGLVSGARYAIAYTKEGVDSSRAVGTTALSGGRLQQTAGTVAEGRLYLTEDMMTFTLGKGNAEGTYTLCANNYNGTASDTYLCLAKGKPEVSMSDTATDLSVIFTPGTTDVSIRRAGDSRQLLYQEKEGFANYPASNAGNNGYHGIQLYREEKAESGDKPGTPTVTVTLEPDGDAQPTEDKGTYRAINRSTITITSKGATAMKINGSECPAAAGIFSLTAETDTVLVIQGVNAAGASPEYRTEVLVDYEAGNMKKMHLLSKKQKDREDSTRNAPVKFTDWVFLRGHYMLGGEQELLWLEDMDGNASVIYSEEGEFGTVSHSLAPNVMMRNFRVRSGALPFSGRPGAGLVGWTKDTVNDINSHEYQSLNTDATGADGTNEYRLQRFHGDVTFTAGGGLMRLANDTDKVVELKNVLTIKRGGERCSLLQTGGERHPHLRTAEDEFNWKPGEKWPEAGTVLKGIYLAGFVMAEKDGEGWKYVVYPAQVSDNEDNMTGVDDVEEDWTGGVTVREGRIEAPSGSRIYSLKGEAFRSGERVDRGVYVVLLPGGKTVKVLVR